MRHQAETDRQRDRQTERQTDRETDRETDRQRDRQTDRETDRETDRQRDRQTERQTDRETDRETDRHLYIRTSLMDQQTNTQLAIELYSRHQNYKSIAMCFNFDLHETPTETFTGCIAVSNSNCLNQNF